MVDAPRIWVPRCKIIEPRNEIIVRPTMRGRYKLTARNKYDWVRRETPWFDNLILDAGLEKLGSEDSVLGTFAVGTGSTAPTAADTALGSLLASTTDQQSRTGTIDSSSPYGMTLTIVRRFDQGEAEGNLAEVGAGWGAATLFSRALILDDEGSPTTFTVQSDEFLDVTYQVTFFPPLSDVTATIDISGTDHDTVFRTCNAASDQQSGWNFDNPAFLMGMQFSQTAARHAAYASDIGAITAAPTGTQFVASSAVNATYIADSYKREATITWELNNGNVSGGIGSVRLGTGSSTNGTGAFQCSYSPAIVKDNTKVLALNYSISWARGT